MLFHLWHLLSGKKKHWTSSFYEAIFTFQLLLLEVEQKNGSLVICNSLGDMAATLAQLGRAADESAAASPDENSCVSFKCLMEINTLSSQCIAHCNAVKDALCWIRQPGGVVH